MRCEELFKERSLWQKDAFDRIKASLLTARDNAFLQYDGMQESYLVVVYGPSQIGKTSLILKLIGIRDDNDCFQKVSQTLQHQGNHARKLVYLHMPSSTPAPIQSSMRLRWRMNRTRSLKSSFSAMKKELEAKLIEMRSRVVKNREPRAVSCILISRGSFLQRKLRQKIYM